MKQRRELRGRNHAEGSLGGLIETMTGSAGKELLALLVHHRIERPSCLENPRPRGAASTLTENVASPFQAEPTQDLRRLQDPRIVPREYLATISQPITGAFGTPGFMAPEQEDDGLVTAKTDIFGLGVTLVHLFAPAKPNRLLALQAVFLDEALPKRLRDLVLRMTDGLPHQRPESMKAILDEFDAIDREYHQDQGRSMPAQNRLQREDKDARKVCRDS